jgi:hypothetical protein
MFTIYQFVRLILGKQGEQWKIRNNEEIDETLNKGDIVRFIRARRTDWLRHVEKIDSNRMPRKILYEKISTKRVRGRPKLR